MINTIFIGILYFSNILDTDSTCWSVETKILYSLFQNKILFYALTYKKKAYNLMIKNFKSQNFNNKSRK